jgi:hypothetical protein
MLMLKTVAGWGQLEGIVRSNKFRISIMIEKHNLAPVV